MAMRQFLSGCLVGAAFSVVLASQAAHAEAVNWRRSLDAAKVEAGGSGRFVLLHFWTPTCGPCRVLERDVFSLPHIAAAMEKDFVPVKVNAEISQALASMYGVDRVPSEILLSPRGTPLVRLGCPTTADAYAAQLAEVAQHFRKASASADAQPSPAVLPAYAGLQIGGMESQAPRAQPPARPSEPALSQPTVTTNPYISKPPLLAKRGVAAAAPAPATQSTDDRYAAPAKPRAVPTPPANAMPNSYRTPAPTESAAVKVASAPGASAPPALATPDLASSAPAQLAEVQPTSAHSSLPPKVEISLTEDGAGRSAASTPTAPSAEQVKLPEGSPPLAFDGYCPVSLKYDRKWVKGQLKFGAYHLGRTYLFAGEQQQKQFLADPDAYSPVFGGLDAVRLLDDNHQVEGSRKFGFEYMGAFYLFSSKETMARFAGSRDRYSAGVRQAMHRMEASSSHVIRR